MKDKELINSVLIELNKEFREELWIKTDPYSVENPDIFHLGLFDKKDDFFVMAFTSWGTISIHSSKGGFYGSFSTQKNDIGNWSAVSDLTFQRIKKSVIKSLQPTIAKFIQELSGQN